MKRSWEGWLYGVSLVAMAAGSLVLAPGQANAADITITMAAPDWPPTRFMKEEFDRSFKS